MLTQIKKSAIIKVFSKMKTKEAYSVEKEMTFGSFLKEKRIEKGITLRQFAIKVNLSPVHMSNLENDRRSAPKEDVLERISKELILTKDEHLLMHDFAAKSKNIPSVSSDLPNYIMENDIVRAALRTAKEVDATDSEWLEFIEKLKKRSNTDK